jgi:hypothetical protein
VCSTCNETVAIASQLSAFMEEKARAKPPMPLISGSGRAAPVNTHIGCQKEVVNQYQLSLNPTEHVQEIFAFLHEIIGQVLLPQVELVVRSFLFTSPAVLHCKYGHFIGSLVPKHKIQGALTSLFIDGMKTEVVVGQDYFGTLANPGQIHRQSPSQKPSPSHNGQHSKCPNCVFLPNSDPSLQELEASASRGVLLPCLRWLERHHAWGAVPASTSSTSPGNGRGRHSHPAHLADQEVNSTKVLPQRSGTKLCW